MDIQSSAMNVVCTHIVSLGRKDLPRGTNLGGGSDVTKKMKIMYPIDRRLRNKSILA